MGLPGTVLLLAVVLLAVVLLAVVLLERRLAGIVAAASSETNEKDAAEVSSAANSLVAIQSRLAAMSPWMSAAERQDAIAMVKSR